MSFEITTEMYAAPQPRRIYAERLERNRLTAQQRRQRKKTTASALTAEKKLLETELAQLMNVYAALPPASRCIIDEKVMSEKAEVVEDQPPPESMPELLSEAGDFEERRKRRLERNAASARLCRARKKLYISNLRRELPVLGRKIAALRAAIPPTFTLAPSSPTNISSIPCRPTWDEGIVERTCGLAPERASLPVAKRARKPDAKLDAKLLHPAIAQRAANDPDIVHAAVTLFEVAQRLAGM